jgi:hypothetical protein
MANFCEEHCMKSFSVVITLAAVISVGSISEADAQAQFRINNAHPHAGACPVGTCAAGGGPKANDVKNCKKEHCAGHNGAPNSQKK